MSVKHPRRALAGDSQAARDRDRLIGDYEWLRRMMRLLDMQTEQVDRQISELEKLLPDDYSFPGDPVE
jgi:hypothetical protein